MINIINLFVLILPGKRRYQQGCHFPISSVVSALCLFPGRFQIGCIYRETYVFHSAYIPKPKIKTVQCILILLDGVQWIKELPVITHVDEAINNAGFCPRTETD